MSHKAQERARNRWAITHKRQRLKNKEIREYVEGSLKKGWSPEIIAGRLSIDNSSENTKHEEINKVLDTKSYFCEPCKGRD